MSAPRLKLSSMLKCLPVAFMSCFQWRGRMAGWCSADTSGSDVCIAFSASSSFLSVVQQAHAHALGGVLVGQGTTRWKPHPKTS
jgi:hypothetical protein